MQFRRQISWAIFAYAITTAFAFPPVIAQNAPVVLKEFNAWSLHQSRDTSHNICYAVTKPIQKAPKSANRAAVVFYVTTWPKDGVRNQVSVKLGYPINAEKGVFVEVDGTSFKLSARDERAYVYDATRELKLIEAMKKGSKMIVKATSKRGTRTTDTYSLSGISAALKALSNECS